MITIDTKQIIDLRFDVAVSHADIRDLTGRFIISSNEVDYGFPVKIIDSEIHVRIPPLQNVIQGLINNEKLSCRVELISGDTLLIPYEDTCLIEISVEVKVEIKNQSQNETIHLDELDKIIGEQRLKNMAREIDDKLRFKLRRK